MNDQSDWKVKFFIEEIKKKILYDKYSQIFKQIIGLLIYKVKIN